MGGPPFLQVDCLLFKFFCIAKEALLIRTISEASGYAPGSFNQIPTVRSLFQYLRIILRHRLNCLAGGINCWGLATPRRWPEKPMIDTWCPGARSALLGAGSYQRVPFGCPSRETGHTVSLN